MKIYENAELFFKTSIREFFQGFQTNCTTRYSQTPIYRASIYRVPPFTGASSFLPNTGFMCKLM